MTRMKTSVQINNSISPIDNKVASADATEDSEDKGKETGEEQAEELGLEGPEEREEPTAKDEADIEAEIPKPGEDFEVRKHRIGRRPMAPTKAEIDEHFPMHLSYRSWCKHCVAGKARLDQHRSDDPNRERLGVT